MGEGAEEKAWRDMGNICLLTETRIGEFSAGT
jgi:hypothetical protein